MGSSNDITPRQDDAPQSADVGRRPSGSPGQKPTSAHPSSQITTRARHAASTSEPQHGRPRARRAKAGAAGTAANNDSRTGSGAGTKPTSAPASLRAAFTRMSPRTRIVAAALSLVLVAAVSTAAIATALSTRDSLAATGPLTAVTVFAPGEEIGTSGDEASDPAAVGSDPATDPALADPADPAATDPAADPAATDPDTPADPADPDPAADDPDARDPDAPVLDLADSGSQAAGTDVPEQLEDQLNALVEEKREEKVKTQTEYGDIESMLAYVTENGTQEEIDRYTNLLNEYAQKLTKLDEDIELYTQ